MKTYLDYLSHKTRIRHASSRTRSVRCRYWWCKSTTSDKLNVRIAAMGDGPTWLQFPPSPYISAEIATIGSSFVSVYPQAPVPTSNQVPFVKAISNQLSTDFHQLTSPVWVMRFSSDIVAVPSSRNGAARTVNKIVHSVIKTVVNLYMLTVSEGTRCWTREEDVRGWSSTRTYFDIQSIGPYIPWRQAFTSHIRYALQENWLLCQL
jgi:hypothetical protein